MTMFIELTGKDSNEKMSFNVDHIVFVAPHKTVKGDKDEGTMIVTVTDTDDSYFVVQESYEEVKKLCNGIFIAHDSKDDPRPTEEVRRLREENKKLQKKIKELQEEKDEWFDKYMRSDSTVLMQYDLLKKAQEKIERYEKSLKRIIELGPLGGSYSDLAAAVEFQKIARDALEGGE